jgi:S-adenosylmethionine uptake transporter
MPINFFSHKTRLLEAIGLVLAGYFAYSVADLCSKKLQDIYSVYQILAVCGIAGFVITGVWLLARHGSGAFVPHNLKMHLFRALLVLGSSNLMVKSLQTLPLADFYGVTFIVPFFVMILAVVFLGERVGRRRCGAALVGFLGVVMLARPQFNDIGEGIIYALLGAVCNAGNIVALKKIGHDAPVPLYGFYVFLAFTVFNLFMMEASGSYKPFEAAYIPYFLIHGPVVILALLFISIGFAKAPEAVVVAPFQYTQIVWGVAFGWYFFSAMPTAATWVGLAMVIGAGLYSLWREYRIAPRPN